MGLSETAVATVNHPAKGQAYAIIAAERPETKEYFLRKAKQYFARLETGFDWSTLKAEHDTPPNGR